MSTPSLRPQLARAAEILVRDYLAVTAGETVLITMDDAGDRTAVDAIVNSAKNIGAKPGIYITPQLPFQGALADPYINESLAAVVKACDMWIDLTFPYIAGSAAYEDAMTSNRARYFLGGDMRSESLVRLFGRADLDLMFDVHETFNALLTPGKECRIANDAGTDITFKLTAPPFPKPRQADKAGLYLVPGNVPMWPDCDSVKGTIVISAAFHEYYTVLPTPIALTIDGQIREVTGGDNERRVLDRALKRAGGGIYGQVIHFSYGYHPGARFTGCCFVEDTRTAGNNACGLGLPFWQPGGGENHPDGVIKMQSIWVDGEQLVDDGAMVGPPQLAALGAIRLRASGEHTGTSYDMRAVRDGGIEMDIGDSETLLEFAEAVIKAAVEADDERLAAARQAVQHNLGVDVLVDAAAVVGAFSALGRVADACGVELEEDKAVTSTALRRELNVESFGKAR